MSQEKVSELEALFVDAVQGALVKLDFDKWPWPIYVLPKAAMQTRQKAAYGRALREETDAEIALAVCVLRCRDENGSRLFTAKDKDSLATKVSSEDLEQIAQEMIKIDGDYSPGKS